MSVTRNELEKLKETMPFKWKVQTGGKGKKKGQCVAYIDARQLFDKLDDVVGPENWQTDFKVINDILYGGVGIKIDGEWCWKWDVGTESMSDADKGAASDALKRAGVQWGVGRFLYSIGMQWIDLDPNDGKPVDKLGNKLFTGEQVTKAVNDNMKNFKRSGSINLRAKVEEDKKPKTVYSDELIARIKALKIDDKEGRDVLLSKIPDYNERFGKAYRSVSEFKTEAELQSLVDFIDSTTTA